MTDSAPTPPPPAGGGLLLELERPVPDLPTTTLVELAARLDELIVEASPQPAEVDRALGNVLERR